LARHLRFSVITFSIRKRVRCRNTSFVSATGDVVIESGSLGNTNVKDNEVYSETRIRVASGPGSNRSLAARMLGIGRTTLYRRLTELGIKTEN
jgi:transcriptional regulator of acetoin/glycerol metabolism